MSNDKHEDGENLLEEELEDAKRYFALKNWSQAADAYGQVLESLWVIGGTRWTKGSFLKNPTNKLDEKSMKKKILSLHPSFIDMVMLFWNMPLPLLEL